MLNEIGQGAGALLMQAFSEDSSEEGFPNSKNKERPKLRL